MNNQPQDFLSQQQAAPQERAEIARDPYTGANHAMLPGSPQFESYNIGNENNALDGIDQGQFSQGVNIGGLDADSLYSVANSFPNTAHTPPDMTGFDAMRAIPHTAYPIQMSGENMYYDGVHNEAVSFHEVNAQPEIQGYQPTVNQGPASTRNRAMGV